MEAEKVKKPYGTAVKMRFRRPCWCLSGNVYYVIKWRRRNQSTLISAIAASHANLNEPMQAIVLYMMEGVFFAGAIAIILLKRNEIKKFIKKRKVEKGLLGLTFTSVWMIIFLAFQILQGESGIEKLPI